MVSPLSGKTTVLGLSKFQSLLVVEALLFVSVMVFVASIFVPNWRSGGGSTFLYPPALHQGFDSRSYGLIYVEGLRKISWAELSTSICDRWGLYSNTASLFDIAPMCTNSPKDAAECTNLFETHLHDRCESYAAMTIVSWITMGIISIATVMTAVTSIVMLVISLGVWKRFVLASLFSASILVVTAILSWGLLTAHYFQVLYDTATFPEAPLSVGFWLAVGAGSCLVIATFIFWRLSNGLHAKADRMSVSQAKLLDIMERRYLDHETVKLIDDSDNE